VLITSYLLKLLCVTFYLCVSLCYTLMLKYAEEELANDWTDMMIVEGIMTAVLSDENGLRHRCFCGLFNIF